MFIVMFIVWMFIDAMMVHDSQNCESSERLMKCLFQLALLNF